VWKDIGIVSVASRKAKSDAMTREEEASLYQIIESRKKAPKIETNEPNEEI
jgi:hypothetical protein